MECCYFPFLWRTFGCGGHFRIQRYHVLGVLWSLNSVLAFVFEWRNRFAWSGKTGQKSRYMGFSMERCHFPFLWRRFGCGGHFRIQRYRVLGVLWSLNSVLDLFLSGGIDLPGQAKPAKNRDIWAFLWNAAIFRFCGAGLDVVDTLEFKDIVF